MGHDELVIIGRLTGALVIGAMIGFERSFHGRPAGFRTHALVCLASALLMLVTVYQLHWMTEVPIESVGLKCRVRCLVPTIVCSMQAISRFTRQ